MVSALPNFNKVSPKIGSLDLIDTTPTGFILSILANLTNPTNYSASVSSFNIQVLANNTVLGVASTKNIEVVPGFNSVPVTIKWDPEDANVSKELISQYLSGKPYTILKIYLINRI
jgi:hypothetical protein